MPCLEPAVLGGQGELFLPPPGDWFLHLFCTVGYCIDSPIISHLFSREPSLCSCEFCGKAGRVAMTGHQAAGLGVGEDLETEKSSASSHLSSALDLFRATISVLMPNCLWLSCRQGRSARAGWGWGEQHIWQKLSSKQRLHLDECMKNGGMPSPSLVLTPPSLIPISP